MFLTNILQSAMPLFNCCMYQCHQYCQTMYYKLLPDFFLTILKVIRLMVLYFKYNHVIYSIYRQHNYDKIVQNQFSIVYVNSMLNSNLLGHCYYLILDYYFWLNIMLLIKYIDKLLFIFNIKQKFKIDRLTNM